MIIIAENVTETKADGTSDYAVQMRLANGKVIAEFIVEGHVRVEPASVLLRKIADAFDHYQTMAKQLQAVN
jgi:hypothetical protein